MTIVLRDRSDRTTVLACGPDGAGLATEMQFMHVELPRSLDEDRRFIADLSDPAWNGVRLSGIETPADIEKASTLLRVAEANRDVPPNSIVILVVLDTARAALGLARFDRSIPRLAGFIFDPDAVARASGVAPDSDLVADLRLRLPLAARACGVTAFLTVEENGPEMPAMARKNGYGGLCVRET